MDADGAVGAREEGVGDSILEQPLRDKAISVAEIMIGSNEGRGITTPECWYHGNSGGTFTDRRPSLGGFACRAAGGKQLKSLATLPFCG